MLSLFHRAFAAFVTYFIVGAVFLRVKHQKSGTDLIIHKEFWKDFPYLLKVYSNGVHYFNYNTLQWI